LALIRLRLDVIAAKRHETTVNLGCLQLFGSGRLIGDVQRAACTGPREILCERLDTGGPVVQQI
jgi:hypothetical protein